MGIHVSKPAKSAFVELWTIIFAVFSAGCVADVAPPPLGTYEVLFNGGLEGTVVDANGAWVPNTEMTLTLEADLKGKHTLDVRTNSSGKFRVLIPPAKLPVDVYSDHEGGTRIEFPRVLATVTMAKQGQTQKSVYGRDQTNCPVRCRRHKSHILHS
jgi:hypothetical protein